MDLVIGLKMIPSPETTLLVAPASTDFILGYLPTNLFTVFCLVIIIRRLPLTGTQFNADELFVKHLSLGSNNKIKEPVVKII